MKNTFPRNLILGLSALMLILALSTCKKNSNENPGITGKWVNTQFQGIQQYQFNNDNTFEFDALTTDSVTKAVIGYRYKTVGKYTIKKDSLIMSELSNYINSKNSFGPVTELVPTTGATTTSYSFSLNSQKTILSFYFTCPLNANCIPSPIVYHKE